jgi:hypothetical protein
MPWKQLRDADMTVGYTGGWCLAYVQDAFKTDHQDPDAMDAWNDNYLNGNHPNELPPVGKTVPVYFSLGNVPQGHVAISLDDGFVASSTLGGYHPKPYFHPNLQHMIDMYAKYNGGCTYLGWSEYVSTTRVVEWVEPLATVIPEPVTAPVIVPEPIAEPPVVVEEPKPEPDPVIIPEPTTKPVEQPKGIVITSDPNLDNPTFRYKTWFEKLIESIISLLNKLIRRK